MNNKITRFILNSLYGKMSPKYEIGYRFKDSRDNEYEIKQRQLIGGIIVYAIIGTKTGFINILTEASIDFIVGGARRCEEMSKYKLDKSAQVVENTNYIMTQEEVCERLNDLEAKLAESEEKCKKAYQEGLLQKQFDKDMEIEQLKQQLHDLPKKIVKEIINNADLQSFDYGERYCEEEASNDWAIDLEDLKEILDTILKKYGGIK